MLSVLLRHHVITESSQCHRHRETEITLLRTCPRINQILVGLACAVENDLVYITQQIFGDYLGAQ